MHRENCIFLKSNYILIISTGGCKHGIAFLMWANRRYESPSPTDVECYWKKSNLSGVGTSQKFITASQMAKPRKNKNEDFGDNSTFLSKIIEESKTREADSQLSRHVFDLPGRKVNKLSMHQLVFAFCQKKHSKDNFLKYAAENMSQDSCTEAEAKTRNQRNDILWHEFRFGRITASNLYETSRCQTPEGCLVNRIIGAAKLYDTIYMKRGRILEHSEA